MRHGQRRVIQAIRGHHHIHPGGPLETAELCDAVGMRAGQRVLDLGSGFGGTVAWMGRERGVDPVGLDLELANLRLAGGQWGRGVSLVGGDACHLPFRHGSFQAVVCWCVLGYVADLPMLLREVRRVLAPGGVFGAHLYTRQPGFVPRPGGMEHVRTLVESQRAWQAAGFHSPQATDITARYQRWYRDFLRLAQTRRAALVERFGAAVVEDAISAFQVNIRQVLDGCKGGARLVAGRR